MECWTLHEVNPSSFAYIVEKGRSYQALTLDEKIFFKMANNTLVNTSVPFEMKQPLQNHTQDVRAHSVSV